MEQDLNSPEFERLKRDPETEHFMELSFPGMLAPGPIIPITPEAKDLLSSNQTIVCEPEEEIMVKLF